MILGLYLDCSRNAVFKPEEIKKHVDYLSALGYTELYLYMEDTYELPNEPYFGYFRSKYSAEELKDLDDYCYSKGIELIPAIQVLAHTGLLKRWQKYYHMMDIDGILLVDDETVNNFIDSIFSYFRSVLRTNKINIGMDEAHNLGRGRYLELHGYKKSHEILLDHLFTVSKMLKKYNYTGFIWSDLFFKFASCSGGYSFKGLDQDLFKEVAKKVPDNIEVVFWEYGSRDQEFYDNMLALHKNNFKSLNFAGSSCCWFGFAPLNALAMDISEIAIKSCLKNNTTRIINTLWGDGGGQFSLSGVLPTIVAWAEYAKGNFNLENIKRTFKQLTGSDWDTIMLLDIPNRIAMDRLKAKNKSEGKPDIEIFHTNPSFYMLYNDYFCGAFDCFVKEGDGEIYYEYSNILAKYISEKNYGDLFNVLKLLCDVLALKYDLGVKTRRLYKAKDKAGLQKLVENEYSNLPEKLEAFISAYHQLWRKEKKTCGIEVEDVRIGGLIQRAKSCKKMLQDFIDNDLVISELEQEMLDYYGNNEITQLPAVCFHYDLLCTNNFLTHVD